MADKNGKMSQPQYDDNVGKIRGNTTTRRYVPGMYDTQRIVTEDVYEEDETEEEEYDQPDTVIPRRGSAKLVAPLMLSPIRQPARTRNTEAIQQVKTQQIRIEQPEQPKQPMFSRRRLITGAGLLASGSFALWTTSSFGIAKWSEFTDQLASGEFPSVSISLVCGHNNDSETKRTRLHAWLDTEQGYINFMELPANDASKAKIFQTSLQGMYSGSLSNVKLDLIPSVVGNVHQVIMQATCLDVAILAEPLVLQWLLVDNGGYFHTEQPSK